jgi:GH24 family phage-related lysozyme (muramidase)
LKAFVKKWEWGFRSEAFCDDYYTESEKEKYWIKARGKIRKPPHLCWYWSIGFWTPSKQWEKITLEEWLKRKDEDLKSRDSLITSRCLTDNQRIAVVDFMYQHWKYSWIKELANSCKIRQTYNLIVWWRDYYRKTDERGMVRREQLRINLFYKK